MPIRDKSLQLDKIFNFKPKPSEPNSFCNLLLDKYNECAKKTEYPEKYCKAEYEIIFTTMCYQMLKDEKERNITKTPNH